MSQKIPFSIADDDIAEERVKLDTVESHLLVFKLKWTSDTIIGLASRHDEKTMMVQMPLRVLHQNDVIRVQKFEWFSNDVAYYLNLDDISYIAFPSDTTVKLYRGTLNEYYKSDEDEKSETQPDAVTSPVEEPKKLLNEEDPDLAANIFKLK